jgi:glycerophosphoryl diester phosphodiesterase
MTNIAHRGSSGTHPENTIPAFLAAAADGAKMCELDVQATRDGAVIVMHDDTVDRTTNGSGAVASLTLEQIRTLDAGAKFADDFRGVKVPTLDEVFEAIRGKLGLNIEIKEGAVEREVCATMRRFDALETSLVSSFAWNALRNVRAIDPGIRVALLADKRPRRLIEEAAAMGAYAVNPQYKLATREFCDEAHAQGLRVMVWTVDAPSAMEILADNGVDAIMTNYPARLRDFLRTRGGD